MLLSLFMGAASLDEVKLELIKEYKNNYPKLSITDLELYASALPADFSTYRFIRLGGAKFNRASGYVRAEFKTSENIQRNLFFRYFLKAKLEVLRANKDIKRGERLGALDYSVVSVDFDKLSADVLEKEDDLDLISKASIKKNAILRASMFKDNKLVKKNELVIATLTSENVLISTELTALQAGNLGQKIKLKNNDGKVFQGTVIGKGKVSLE